MTLLTILNVLILIWLFLMAMQMGKKAKEELAFRNQLLGRIDELELTLRKSLENTR